MMESETLRRGHLVEVRGPAEILATLDETACLDGLPFMPEMVAYCGQRLTVDNRTDKLCDTTKYTGSRKLPDSVMLDQLRCDGSGHDGCQARCRMLWKNAWLRRVAPGDPPSTPPAQSDLAALAELARRAVRRTVEGEHGTEQRWRCQLTELFAATTHLKVWDPRTYIGQYTNGNVGLGRCLRITARAAIEEPLRKLHLTPTVYLPGTATGPVDDKLDLQPGEWVQVRSKEEIRATLTPAGYNRGLWFDREMAAYCGGIFRVEQRITRFIDDFKSHGCMVELKNDAVTLEGVLCTGDLSPRRWLCPRRVTPYWRECWLKRVDPPAGAGPRAGQH